MIVAQPARMVDVDHTTVIIGGRRSMRVRAGPPRRIGTSRHSHKASRRPGTGSQ